MQCACGNEVFVTEVHDGKEIEVCNACRAPKPTTEEAGEEEEEEPAPKPSRSSKKKK